MIFKISSRSYVKLIWLFFAVLLFQYGRGIDFNVALDEHKVSNLTEETSKAPFLIGSTLFLLVLLNICRKKFDLSHIVNYKLWLSFFALLFLLVFLRENLAGDFKNFGTIIFSFLLLFILMKFAYRVPFAILETSFLKISFFITLVSAVFHLLQGHKIVFFPDRSEQNFDRLGGIFYYAHTGAIMGITLLFAGKKYLETKKKTFLIIAVVTGILLIATDTRSAWFGVGFSSLFLFFRKIKFYKLFILSISFYFLSTSFSSIIGVRTSIGAASEDADYRTKIWAYSLSVASQRLFTGYGDLKPLENNNFDLNDNLHDPHNSIISLFIQSGLISVIFYFFIFFSNCRKSIRYYNSSYRFLFFFWFFFPMFWGSLYNSLSGFVPMYMMFTIYAFALNPNFQTVTTTN